MEQALENLEESRDLYQQNQEYFRHLENELRMFHTVFDAQWRFLSSAEQLHDKRSFRVPTFFGLLAVLLFINAYWLGVGKATRDG